jgi:hypothetical protein
MTLDRPLGELVVADGTKSGAHPRRPLRRHGRVTGVRLAFCRTSRPGSGDRGRRPGGRPPSAARASRAVSVADRRAADIRPAALRGTRGEPAARRAAAADLASPRRSLERARRSGVDRPMACRWARAVLRSLSQRAVEPRPKAMTHTKMRTNPPASTIIINIRSPWCGRGESVAGRPRRRPDDPADHVERQRTSRGMTSIVMNFSTTASTCSRVVGQTGRACRRW